MPEQLYNIEYLAQTTRLLKELKEKSYAPFMSIKSGTIADIGCGTGADALNLARLLPDTLQVVGIDNDEKMIGQASRSTGDLKNLSFQTASAEDLPFGNGSLSGIRSERLIQHLNHPENVFREFSRILKPDHPIVIVETDWASVSLYNGLPHLNLQIKSFLATEFVAHGTAALNMAYYLHRNHFKEIRLTAFPLVSHSWEQIKVFLKIDHALQLMEQKQQILPADRQAYLQSLEEAEANHSFICTANLIMVSALK